MSSDPNEGRQHSSGTSEPSTGRERSGATSDHITETSYGGVVVRGTVPEVIAIVPAGKRALTLPKGGADARESGEQTALREVREEAGVVASIREPLGDVNYWYRRSGRRVYKTVHFYLCDYVSGNVEDHDHEVDEARWLPLEVARRTLAYPGERGLLARASERLAEQARER